MRVLVVIFGGADYDMISELGLRNLQQATFGKATATDLWKDQDTATQITSQLITGKTWEQSGVRGRKKYTVGPVEKVEKNLQRRFDGGVFGWIEGVTRPLRVGLYRSILATRGKNLNSRNYLHVDLKTPSLFDMIDDSRSLYVPSYDPEPSWAIRRNILNPERFPDLGHEGALDLAEKNFEWRKSQFLDLSDENHDLLMTQFQYLDSLQHLSLWRTDPPNWDSVNESYKRINKFAGEIINEFDQYDRILFISDNGIPKPGSGRTHMDRPFYSINETIDISENRIIDFHQHIKDWLQSPPNPVLVSTT